jgi:hypothetical protein
MRFSTPPHPLYCGIDRPARTMDVCLLRQDGEGVLHRNRQAAPEPVRKAIAPSRDAIVVAVACLFTWDGLADLCAQAGRPWGRGQARAMQALQGGTATNDPIDSQKMAVWLRGGLRPPASVSPAERRAPRALWRRRWPRTRTRAEWRAHVQQTPSQSTLPEIGTQIASTAHRDGGAERFPAPAGPTRVAGDRARIASADRLRSDLALTIRQTATPHAAPRLSRLQSVPGMGTIVRVVWLYARPASTRVPRGQACVASCRLVTCAKASAGNRSGTSGANMGHASRTGACAEAAGLLRRHQPMGHTYLARLEHTHGKGNALTIFAHPLARAVSELRKRATVCDRHTCLHGSWSGAGEPHASLDTHGHRLVCRALLSSRRQRTRRSP